ncbi:MAG: pantetheine-phosphate adenylyltransferase [Chlamydiales bacterium]|jgi:pantetheine-phosphate adenylyltransferase
MRKFLLLWLLVFSQPLCSEASLKKGLFAGSFNPPTKGHLDLIERASSMCDVLYVVVAFNTHKASVPFSIEERVSFLKDITRTVSNVKILSWDGLLVDFASENDIHFFIRGLRNGVELEYERSFAVANGEMSNLDTIFLLSSPRYAHLSSSLVREVGRFGRSLERMVPEEIEGVILERLSEGKS